MRQLYGIGCPEEEPVFLNFSADFSAVFVIVQLFQEGHRDQVLAFVFGLRNWKEVYRRVNHTEGTKSLGFREKGMSDR